MHEVTTIPIGVIQIPEERQRKEFDQDQIDALAQSIEDVGLLQFPVLNRDYTLRAGERRYLACKQLGWQEIPVHFIDQVEPLVLQRIEFEENIRRVDLTWQERNDAITAYHSLCLAADPEWTHEKTATALNVSRHLVAQNLEIKEQRDKGNVKVLEAKKFSEARTITKRTKDREAKAAIAKINETPSLSVPIVNANFVEWIDTYDGAPFNFIHCDFPYGIQTEKRKQGSAHNTLTTYEDSYETYQTLISALEKAMEKVVAPEAHLIFWFSMDFYQETKELLTAMGWKVNPFPLIWLKSDNTGLLPDPLRGPRRIYETAFFATRGDLLISQPVANAFAAPGKDLSTRIHISEKNKPMLEHFFRMVVDGNTRMLDPTCGSASSLKAAKAEGAAEVLGLEINEEIYKTAVENF